MIKSFFDWLVRHKLLTYDNIQNIPTGEEDDYITDCFLDYNYFINCYKMTAIDLTEH